MSYYTEKNGLAQFWNRDHTRLEWAKWVYHHPEQTEKLIEMLLQASDDAILTELQTQIIEATQVNDIQTTKIQALLNSLANTLTNQDIDQITGVELDGN